MRDARQTHRSRSLAGLAVAAIVFAVAGAPLTAAAVAPHVAQSEDTDACAMCHRSKTATARVNTEWSRVVASETGDAEDLRNALLVGSEADDDTGLCFSCHGVERLGSATDVQSAFESTSAHSLAPEASAYGRSPKQCSTCHDSHGTDKVDGSARPSLLRSIVSTSEVLHSGDAYCATCHKDRTADRFDGLDIWAKTAHASALTSPASGTDIICSVCHAPHGSGIAPLIRTSMGPPAFLSTVTVQANGRTLCLLCHQYAVAPGSWVSSDTYAPSAHASSVATVAVAGEWPTRSGGTAVTSRLVGECQSCHAPMGSRDGTGTAIVPRLLEKRGRKLCDDCHDADGPARSNVASLAYPAKSDGAEVVAVWRPSIETSIYGDVAVWTRDVTETVPAALTGPRVFAPARRTGDAAAGDIDGVPGVELVVCDSSRAYVDVYFSDAVQGMKRRSHQLPNGVQPFLVEVANVVAHGSGPHGAQDERAEIAVVARDPEPPHASSLHVYTFSGSELETITASGGLGLGDNASDVAAGDLDGDGKAELVVTSMNDPAAGGDGTFRVFTESGATVGQTGSVRTTGPSTAPRGVSIGDVWEDSAGNDIVICYSGFSPGEIAVFSGSGDPLGTRTVDGFSGAKYAYDSAVGNVLWDTAGAEVLVALRSNPTTDLLDATSSVNVFAQFGGGLAAAATRYPTGDRYESSAVEMGDVDGDGRAEVVVGNSGKWLRGTVSPLWRSPSLTVFDSQDGSTLTLERTLWSTGVEQASGIVETTTTALGTAPAVVVADFGQIGPSRHPGDAGTVAHVSTETAGAGRHVTCADCHNAHETTATVPAMPSAIYGALKGAWGALITGTGAGTYTASQHTSPTAEYQVCLKCHSSYMAFDRTRDVASEFTTANASTHGVVGPSLSATVPASTFVTPTTGMFVNATPVWTSTSQLYCIDCHTNPDAAQAKGPHVSRNGSLLRRPVWGVTVGDAQLLCYLCHKRSVYFDGDPGSRFYNYGKPDMHKLHTKDTGFSCRTCHVSHGSAGLPHLQNADNGYEHLGNGGACTTACHTGGARHPYKRAAPSEAVTPTAIGVSAAATYTPTAQVDMLAAVGTLGGTQLVVAEGSGGGARYSIEMTFTGVAALPSSVEFYGRYQGSPGHIVRVWAWDYTSALTDKWTALGRWASTAVPGTFSYAVTNAGFLSGGGNVRIRIYHESPGNAAHIHYLDFARLNP